LDEHGRPPQPSLEFIYHRVQKYNVSLTDVFTLLQGSYSGMVSSPRLETYSIIHNDMCSPILHTIHTVVINGVAASNEP
jgi:hypothetical protein